MSSQFFQIRVKDFDGHVTNASLTTEQAMKTFSYMRSLGIDFVKPASGRQSIDTHNAIATYHGGTNPND